jgi:hypothetical protein
MLMHSRGKGRITFLDLELKIIVEKRETKKRYLLQIEWKALTFHSMSFFL